MQSQKKHQRHYFSAVINMTSVLSTLLLVDVDYCFMTLVFAHVAKTKTGAFSKHLNSVTNHNHHWLYSPMWALALLRSFCQLKYPATASLDFVTKSLSRVGLSAPCPTPGYTGRPMFSVRVVSLS
jgi:hypothetical protein